MINDKSMRPLSNSVLCVAYSIAFLFISSMCNVYEQHTFHAKLLAQSCPAGDSND